MFPTYDGEHVWQGSADGHNLRSGGGERHMTPLPAAENTKSASGYYTRDGLPVAVDIPLRVPPLAQSLLRSLYPGGLWAEQEKKNTKQVFSRARQRA